MKDDSVREVESESATDSTLLRSAIANDQAAWRELVAKYGPRVYQWARQAGLKEADAADITNQVFLSVAQALPRLRRESEKDTFRGWLRRITQNAVRDFGAAAAKAMAKAVGGSDNLMWLQNQRSQEESATQSSAPVRVQTSKQAAIARVRAATSDKKWRVFWLVTAEERPPDEVAKMCNVSVQSVYLTKHRISKRIQRELEKGV